MILTAYRRPENLAHLVAALRRQTITPQIFIWDNGQNPDLPEVDLVVRASSNLFCWPRWNLATFASNQHCFVIDDDMAIQDPRLLEEAIAFMTRRPDVDLIGYSGAAYLWRTPFPLSRHLQVSRNRDRDVDVVKGQFVGFRKEFLRQVPILPPLAPIAEDPSVEDDITVSACAKVKVLPSCLFGKIMALNGLPHALCARPDHAARRQTMLSIAFPP